VGCFFVFWAFFKIFLEIVSWLVVAESLVERKRVREDEVIMGLLLGKKVMIGKIKKKSKI
jgi:hypothetical protein